MKLAEIWQRLFNTKYSAILQAEVARLRAENRALLNSILGIAGVPLITIGGADPSGTPSVPPTLAAETKQNGVPPGRGNSRPRAKDAVNVAAATRRRSWHQVYRMLEIDAARKKEVI
jgi:hypothetical protein